MDKAATHYAFGRIPFFPEDILDKLETIVNNSNLNDAEELKQIIGPVRSLVKLGLKGSLGNALILTLKSYERWKVGKKLLDFNLDGDRGYAYPCWNHVHDGDENTSDSPNSLDTSRPINLRFIK